MRLSLNSIFREYNMWHVTVLYPGNVSEVYDFSDFKAARSFSLRHKQAGNVTASSPWHDDAVVECETYKAIEEGNKAIIEANAKIEWF